MELKEVLHLYLGCEVEYLEKLVLGNSEKRIAKFYGLDDRYVKLIPITFKGELSTTSTFSRKISDVKLILRPLSDMTEEEITNAIEPMTYGLKSLRGKELHLQAAELTRYLLSKHFDLFGLLESGQAISKPNL